MGKHREIELTSAERDELEKLTRRGHTGARMQTRARILLLSDRSQGERRTAEQVAQAVMCSRSTVMNIRKRYLDNGLVDALHERPRPGQKPKVTGEIEAQLTLLACSEPPEGLGRWTLRLLAEQMVELGYVDSLSHVTVGEVLKKTHSSLGESRAGALPNPRPNS